MIRSSKLSLKFANKNKKNNINIFINEYKKVTQFFINELWELEKIPTLLPKDITSKTITWLSARAIQCAGKQASGIVRSIKDKNAKRIYIHDKLVKENKVKKARKLKIIIDKFATCKPNVKNIQPELDSRFVTVDENNNTSFDIWTTLTSLGNKLKIQIPIKKTKHFNSLTGDLKPGIRLSNNTITLMFEDQIKPVSQGKTLGIDIGVATIASTSDNQTTVEDKDGWTLKKIINRLNSKKKDSNGYGSVQRQRTSFINWSINQLNLSNVKVVRLERLRNVRRNVRTSKFLNRWTYTEIISKLELTCEKLGVQVEYVNPTYTSQRCNSCGWVRSSNRKGKLFKCNKCGLHMDADLNAAKNIVANLIPIWKKERLLRNNRTGFYWHEARQECMVPVSQK